MAYIGKTPTPVPLTSSDIASDIINSTHIGDTAISGFDALATSPADTDEFLISDGGVLKRLDASLVGGGGKVLQVVQNVDTNGFNTTSASFVTDSGSTGVSITPSATSSKIYVVAMFTAEVSAGKGRYTFFRGGSNIYTSYLTTSQNVGESTSTSMHYLDSPSTTSEINYKVAVKSNSAGQTSNVVSPIIITAMEIGV